MRNDQKAAAIAVGDYRLWPGWARNRPILENTRDAIRFGELIHPHQDGYEWLRGLAEKERRHLNKLMDQEDGEINALIKIATYIQFLNEACQAWRKKEDIQIYREQTYPSGDIAA